MNILIGIGEKWTFHNGFQYGATSETLTGELYVKPNSITRTRFKSVVGQGLLPTLNDSDPNEKYMTIAETLSAVLVIEKHFAQPVAGCGRIIGEASKSSENIYLVSIPTFNAARTKLVLSYLSACCRAISGNLQVAELDVVKKRFLNHLKFERGKHRHSINNERIIEFAKNHGIPFKFIQPDAVRVGSGKHSHIFKSTITQNTSSMGVAYSASKIKAAQWLERNFLPIPRKALITNLEQAKHQARNIGFPVAIKPDIGRQGGGVTAPINTESEIEAAYEAAKKFGDNIIVEEFVVGRDYRITVDNGKIIKAIERKPGCVVGDGMRTIEKILSDELVAFQNGRKSGQPVRLDDEARLMIQRAGYTVSSVLENGIEVILRRRANMSTGGVARDVLHILHPDNADIAIRATAALKLDIAGIDLISKDISKSWRDSEVKILEVNAQPQISSQFVPDIYREIITSRLNGGTRARVAIFVTDEWTEKVHEAYDALKSDIRNNWGTIIEQAPNGVFRNDKFLARPMKSGIEFVQKAEWDQAAEGILACPSHEELERNGMPTQFVDRVEFHFGKRETVSNAQEIIISILAKCFNHIAEKKIRVQLGSQPVPNSLIERARNIGFTVQDVRAP